MKDRDKEGKELDDLYREETRRGRRPIDIEERKREQRLREMEEHLCIATEKEFVDVMRASGLQDGSEELRIALALWHGYREP